MADCFLTVPHSLLRVPPLKVLFPKEGLFSKSALTYMEKSCIAGFPWVWSARGILRKKGCIQVGHPAKGLDCMCRPTGPSCRMKGTGISCDLIKSLMNLHCVLHFPAHWPFSSSLEGEGRWIGSWSSPSCRYRVAQATGLWRPVGGGVAGSLLSPPSEAGGE